MLGIVAAAVRVLENTLCTQEGRKQWHLSVAFGVLFRGNQVSIFQDKSVGLIRVHACSERVPHPPPFASTSPGLSDHPGSAGIHQHRRMLQITMDTARPDRPNAASILSCKLLTYCLWIYHLMLYLHGSAFSLLVAHTNYLSSTIMHIKPTLNSSIYKKK